MKGKVFRHRGAGCRGRNDLYFSEVFCVGVRTG